MARPNPTKARNSGGGRPKPAKGWRLSGPKSGNRTATRWWVRPQSCAQPLPATVQPQSGLSNPEKHGRIGSTAPAKGSKTSDGTTTRPPGKKHTQENQGKKSAKSSAATIEQALPPPVSPVARLAECAAFLLPGSNHTGNPPWTAEEAFPHRSCHGKKKKKNSTSHTRPKAPTSQPSHFVRPSLMSGLLVCAALPRRTVPGRKANVGGWGMCRHTK